MAKVNRQAPRGPEDLNCPVYRKPMSEVCENCAMWSEVRGTDPQTGKELPAQWECAYVLQPRMIMEVAKGIRGVHAATNSFRNEMIKAQSALIQQGEIQKQLTNGHDPRVANGEYLTHPDQMKLLED